MAIGRPIELTPNIATKNISAVATADQTQFTVTGGYRINEIAVYRNGVRLADGRDFTASDGSTVNLVSGATASDVIEFAVFDSFNVADAIIGAASSQTVNGDLNVTGTFYAGDFKPTNLVVGVSTINSSLHVGSALTSNAAGDVETVGIITAASFKGDGSGLTGIGETVNVRTETITVSGVSTFTGVSNFSAAINADATTDSTSTSTGALIVDGGLGVAKNVYIGAGLSVAGTLTYEDVTNVDAVGMVTAKSGVNVSGGELNVGLGFSVGHAGIITSTGGIIDLKNSGSVSNIKFYCESSNAHYTALQSAAHSAYSGNVTLTLPTTTDTLIGRTTTDTLTNKTLTSPTINTLSGDTASFSSNLTVGSGITMGSAGVATFSGTSDIHLRDNVKLLIGDGSSNDGDLRLWHDGTHSWIYNYNGQLTLGAKQGEDAVKIYPDEQVELYWNAAKKFETTNDGTVTTGIGTFTEGVAIPDSKYLRLGTGEDFIAYFDGSNTYLSGVAGNVNIQAKHTENSIICVPDGSVKLYHNDNHRLSTTYEGLSISGFTSTSAGMGVTGGLFEGSFIKAGKLSDNLQIGIATANVFYFTTTETATATPNIRWNDTYSLSSKMAVGDVASVTVITTAAAAAYAANWTIDGNAVTEEWVGGSAPSAGGADGLDIYSLTIIKTGTGTGDSGFKVIANVSNAT